MHGMRLHPASHGQLAAPAPPAGSGRIATAVGSSPWPPGQESAWASAERPSAAHSSRSLSREASSAAGASSHAAWPAWASPAASSAALQPDRRSSAGASG
eukprot:scaffold13_cov241-Pinguiococcus_pyrenoidosus.AAC.8